MDFDLEGPRGLYSAVEQRLNERKHAVIVVAEGADQKMTERNAARASSTNIQLSIVNIQFFGCGAFIIFGIEIIAAKRLKQAIAISAGLKESNFMNR